SMTSQERIIPKKAPRRMYSKATPGAHFSNTSAATIPKEDVNRAKLGDPALFSCPRRAGAQPLRAREKSILEETYRAAFAPDKAAVSTTKFIRWAAPGILTRRNTPTNGLSVTPVRFHGMIPTSTVMALR